MILLPFLMNIRKTTIYAVMGVALIGILLVMVLRPSSGVTGTATSSGTVSGTVDLSITDSSVSLTGLDFSTADTATLSSQTRYIFDSESDGGATNDKIEFNEGTTNVKVYYYISVSSFSVPTNNPYSGDYTWILFKETTNTADPNNWNGVATALGAYGAYVYANYSTTVVSGAGSITPPSGVTASFSGTITVEFLGSVSDGDNWVESSFTLYLIVSDTGSLYVDDDADMSETTETGQSVSTLTATGDQISILGNPFVLTSAIPTAAGNSVTFNFGWYSDETANGQTGGTTMNFYTALALRQGIAGTYSASITITGTQYA